MATHLRLLTQPGSARRGHCSQLLAPDEDPLAVLLIEERTPLRLALEHISIALQHRSEVLEHDVAVRPEVGDVHAGIPGEDELPQVGVVRIVREHVTNEEVILVVVGNRDGDEAPLRASAFERHRLQASAAPEVSEVREAARRGNPHTFAAA